MVTHLTSDAATFQEEQRIRQWWLWAILFVSCGAGLAASVTALATVLGRGGGFDRLARADKIGLAGIAVAVVLEVGVPALLWAARLVTEVRGAGLYLRYFPFHLRVHRISLDEVRSVKAVKYHPIGEYGGWGIRYAWKGKAYNATGDLGVRIDYANGRHLLIGSQRPDELAAAISAILPARH